MKKLILGMMLVAGIVSASAQTKENATSSAKAKIDKEEIAKKAAEIAKTKTEKQEALAKSNAERIEKAQKEKAERIEKARKDKEEKIAKAKENAATRVNRAATKSENGPVKVN